jgi:hypothetical protein
MSCSTSRRPRDLAGWQAIFSTFDALTPTDQFAKDFAWRFPETEGATWKRNTDAMKERGERAGEFTPTIRLAVEVVLSDKEATTHMPWFDNIRFRTGSGSHVPNPPAAPQGLITHGGDRRVVLHWEPNSETSVAGYNVFRSLTAVATSVTWEDQGPPATDVPPASVPARFCRVFRLGAP